LSGRFSSISERVMFYSIISIVINAEVKARSIVAKLKYKLN
jgi:hypothetical protein